MRALLAGAACLLLALAAQGESFTVRVEESAVVEIAGATAAYTTNPLVADVVIVSPGLLSVTGHSSGTTQLVVVTAGGTQLFLITVAAPAPQATSRPETGVPQLRYEGRYSSGSARVQNTVDVVVTEDAHRSQFRVLHIHDLRADPAQPKDVIASIFYRYTTPGRELTLLDSIVDVSRMTVHNTQVRGLHLRQGAFELHGGYASSTIHDGFFLPTERRWVGGAGYDIDRHSIRWTPSVYGFFSEPEGTAARRGVVGALAAEHRQGDVLFARVDVGVSRSVAAAGELRYASPRSQFRALFSFKPDDFPTLGLAEIPGTHAELDATRRATSRLSIATHGTYDRLALAAQSQSFAAGGVGLQYALTPRVSLLGGADASAVSTPAKSIRTVGLPLGASYEAPAFGLGVSYRLLSNSETSRRGDSLRLNAHARRGKFTASAWGERQRQAPTLDLIFGAEPGLELALIRLGISVHDPEDVARALRDNAALIDLGFITGVNVNLTPRRLRAGFSLAWMEPGARGNHLRLLAIYGHDDGIRTSRENLLTTLTWSRRVLSETDLYASLSWWRTTLSTLPENGTSVDAGLRQRFSGLPAFLRRSGTIEGIVFLDPQRNGVRSEDSPLLPDITVTLDGTRTARTDGKGAYAFHGVSPGPHLIAAQLPSSPRAFFTTPSHLEAKVPAHIDFGLVWAAARIDGRLISDAALGIPGAIFSATSPGVPPITATSDLEGRFVFAVSPGSYRIALAAESLPPGYSIVGAREREVMLEADAPQSLSFDVQALRSISGRAAGASEARIEALGRTVPVDAAGNFAFRTMPAGTFKISTGRGGGTLSKTVTLSAEPMMLRDVLLNGASVDVAEVMEKAVALKGTHVVQAGAFRDTRNANDLLGGLRRAGEQSFAVARNGLTFVFAGPFPSRHEALAASARLQRAGISGFVTRR